MKKIVKSMVAASMATALLTSAAGAANFTSSADALNKLGLFNGTEKGYELDRVADRAEAATMLVRLMGKEAEAKAFWEEKTAKPEETKLDESVPAAELTPAEKVEETKADEAAAAYTLLDTEMGVAMKGNTLYVADKDKVMAAAAQEGMLSDFGYGGYATMMWAPIGVTVPEGAVKATFSFDGMEDKPIEIDLSKDGEAMMMAVEEGKLLYYVAIAGEKDGKVELWPEETIAAKHFVWLDKDGKELGKTDAALTWSHTAPAEEAKPVEEQKPAEEAKPEEVKPAEEAYVFPFTDMDNGYNWAKPYVAWLYDQGLTAGASATTFEPGSKVTDQMYATFLLRALGYSDKEGADFTYADALKFAKEKGVVDYINLDDTFDRDNLAALSYTALSVQPKSGETDLLTKLVADKAVDEKTAKDTLDTFAALRAFNEAYAKVAATTAADATADFTMNMKVMDETVDASGKFDVQVKVDLEKPAEMAMALKGALSFKMADTKVDLPMEMYIKDGVSYANVGGQKVKQDMELEQTFQGFFDMTAMVTEMQSVPLCMVDAISKDGDTYKMSYNVGAFNGMFAEIFEAMGQSIELTEEMKAQGITEDMLKMSMDLSKCDVTVAFKNGNLASEKMDMVMSMETAGVQVDMNMGMNMKYNKTGDAVKIAYPTDLDSYKTAEELEEQAAEAETEEVKADETKTEEVKADETKPAEKAE